MVDKNKNKNKEGKISKKDLEYLGKKLKETIFPEVLNKGQVFYFHDRESRVFIPFDISTDELEFKHPETNESFTLNKPVLFNKEKPVYWIIREQTKSMDFKQVDVKVKFNKENDKLIFDESLISPTEMRVVQESSARTSILKRDKMSFNQAIITLLCCIITALTIYVICAPFMTSGSVPNNSTSGV